MPSPYHRKLWIDSEGNVIPVPESHEQWANEHGHDLESLLDAGWVRVQNVPPPYLYLDFRRPLNAAQAVAVKLLFENRFDRIVVEFRGLVREFGDGEEAMEYVIAEKPDHSA